MLHFSDKDFEIIEKIGRGGFATVYKAKCLNPQHTKLFGEFVAVKEINKRNKNWKTHKTFVEEEIKIHESLTHPNIVKMFGHFENDDKILLILELCTEGSVEDYRRKQKTKTFKEYDAFKIFKQIVEGVTYLHSKFIMHRDLTLRNVLLTRHMEVKIADFGLSKMSVLPDKKQYTVVGTPNYTAPEIKEKEGYGDKVDCWNLGCILHALLFGEPPREGISRKENISPEAQELLKALLHKISDKRMNIEAVPHSKFFKKYERSQSRSSRSKDSGIGSKNCFTPDYSPPVQRESHLRSRDSGFTSRNSAQTYSRKKSHSMEKLPERLNVDVLKEKYQPVSSRKYYDSHSRERSASQDWKPYIPRNCDNAYSHNERSASTDRERHENFKSHSHHRYADDACRENSSDRYKSQERYKSIDYDIIPSRKTLRTCDSEPTEHCKDPNCKFSNCLLEGKSKVSTCSHLGCCHTKFSHSGICCCHSQFCCRNNPEKLEKNVEHNQILTSPLNAARLRPKRTRINGANIVVHISSDRQVIMEFLKITKKGKTLVSMVFIISTDGLKLKTYKPPKNTCLNDYSPPPLPGDPDRVKTYSYPNFTEDYCRKYLIAKRFVDKALAQAPKLINKRGDATFYVMENSPNPDLRMNFLDGGSVVKKGNIITVTDKLDRKEVVSDPEYGIDFSSMNRDFSSMLKEFLNEKEKCEKMVKFHESLKSRFPIVVGV